MSQAAFRELCDEYVDTVLRLNPVLATLLGVHDHDAELGDPSRGAFRRRLEWIEQMERRRAEFAPAELEAAERVDWRLLGSQLAGERILWERQGEAARNPILYVDVCLFGAYLLYTREFAPLAERVEPLCKRLERTGAYLEAARENLEDCPRLFVETAIEVARSADGFLAEVAERLRGELPDQAARVEAAVTAAREAYAEYAGWLESDKLPHATAEFAVGEEVFSERLRHEHLLDYDATSLEELGWRVLRETQAELDRLAEDISPGRGWRGVVEDTRGDHPQAGEVLDVFRRDVERARRFVIDKRLAPIPDGESLQVVETPEYERSRTPYAAYLQPGPFDAKQVGVFFVTPVDLRLPKEDQDAKLQGHNLHALPVTTLHEAYPGHHLQLCWANRAPSRLRKLADSSVLAEGWALYCEEMMFEEGFYGDPLTRLYQLKDQCWRAARVILDCRLHTGRVSFEEAVRFLVDEAVVERPNAEAEVRRYATTPTQPMSYVVGKLELLALRDEVRRRLGDGFDLFEFHAAVLQAGTLPVGLVREDVLHRLQPRAS